MIVATDVAFGEAPRWRDGKLWWSDMHGGQVCRLSNGVVEKVCEVPGRPSGLGWLPDGRMLVVSMIDKLLLRMEPDGVLVTHADLSALAPRRCNDLTVDLLGRAYVGNFGFELDGAEDPRPTVLIRVDPDGSARIVADDLLFPNGSVITEDQRTLIIAETWGARLSAFDINQDGSLSNRRLWAEFYDGSVPDGICLDAEGAIWIASPTTKGCLRVREGGEVLERIDTGRGAFACVLGEDDGRTLYVCTAESHDPERQSGERNGCIEAFRVETPGVGRPRAPSPSAT